MGLSAARKRSCTPELGARILDELNLTDRAPTVMIVAVTIGMAGPH